MGRIGRSIKRATDEGIVLGGCVRGVSDFGQKETDFDQNEKEVIEIV